MKNSVALFDTTERKIKRALTLWGDFGIDLNLIFGLEIGGVRKHWRITSGRCEPTQDFDTEELYKIRVNSDRWSRYLHGSITFDDLAFGGHISVFQGSKGYSTKFHRLLRGLNSVKHLESVLLAEIKHKNSVRMKKSYKSEIYTIKRYCPHHGYDLIDCEVDNEGHITCPAHGWKFDIRTKKCVRGDKSLNI